MWRSHKAIPAMIWKMDELRGTDTLENTSGGADPLVRAGPPGPAVAH